MRNILGNNLSNFMKKEDLRISEFIDKLTLMGGEEVSERTVTKWKSGETFPSIKNLVLISSIIGVSVDTLLKDEIAKIPGLTEKRSAVSKFQELDERDKKLLIKLILCSDFREGKDKMTTTIHFPIEFMGREFEFSKAKFYTSDEIRAFYKTVAEDAFRRMRIEELGDGYPPDVISKYINVCFDFDADRSIIYDFEDEDDDSDRTYKQLQSYWEKNGRWDVFNVVEFSELVHNYEGYLQGFVSKELHYKTEKRIEKLYNQVFSKLIESGLIELLPTKSDTVCECGKQYSIMLAKDETGEFATSSGDARLREKFEMKSILFNFKLNMQKEEICQILRI